jgi:hypothetical protein
MWASGKLPVCPFEVSRWCLRRTRQQPVCVFNRALVLRRDVAGDLKVDRKMGSLACHSLILGSERMGPTIFAVTPEALINRTPSYTH